LSQLSYYKLTVTVVPGPRALNDEAVQAGSESLQQASEHHERFLATAFVESFGTLDWLRNKAAGTYDIRGLGAFDGGAGVCATRRDP
jgi:hypothetical protein